MQSSEGRAWLRRSPMRFSGSNRASGDDPELAESKPASVAIATAEELKFLEVVTGDTPESGADLTPQQRVWLTHIRAQFRQRLGTTFQDLLCPKQSGNNTPSSVDGLNAAWFSLLSGLAEILAEESQLSIDKAIRLLSDPSRQQLSPLAQSDILRNKARSLVFCCMSWITMLYSADLQRPNFDNLCIDHNQCPSIPLYTQPSENADSPLCELLQEFGPLLPTQDDEVIDNVVDPVFSANSFYVSLLNAATLSHLGGIQIQWVENFSSHLKFDPELQHLYLFRLPSFCDVLRHKSPVLSKIMSEYYDDYNRPHGFSVNAFLKEIRQSYQLIFADAHSSRRFFTSKELRRLRKYGPVDPFLNSLCGLSSRKTTQRNSYSKITDFPILAPRLSKLQDYVMRQNPTSLRMLWRDKRNSYQWWTLWAVVVIGCTGVLLSIIQTLLSALQVYYTAHSDR